MIGSEYVLDVYLGRQIIASLTLVNDKLNWTYRQTWQDTGYAISPHLPLQGDISSINVQRFLRNLLPEGQGLDELVRYFHLSRFNTFGLVKALGKDMPGALVLLASQQLPPESGTFRLLTHDEMEQRLDSRDEFSLLLWDGKPRLSVAGVQDKINVVMNWEGQLGLGDGTLCSTHILKFEKQRYSHLVLNEYITMQLAKQCGLQVANVKLLYFGKHPALLVERFDRKLLPSSEVQRRHIIDGCQALNLSPDEKYERQFGSGRDVAHIRDGASFIKLFDFANLCTNPALTKQQMLDWALFNLLIFNFDAHGKNISFFVGQKGISLSPFYDLVNIKMYPDFDHEMAMGLGDAFDSDSVYAYQLADFADSCKLPRTLLATRLRLLIKKLIVAVDIEIKQVVSTEEEKEYLRHYQSMICERCKYFLSQIDEIVSFEL